MFKGFRTFILRGNVIDLAVGVVIGAAFGAVVTSFTTDILTPLISAIFGKPDFSYLVADLNGAKIAYGKFLNALIAFLLVAFAVYYFVITPVNALVARVSRGEVQPDPTTKQCPQCLMEIPIAAKKCGHCTSALA